MKPKGTRGKISATYDVVIIGAGSAGIAAVDGAKAAGAKSICLIESEQRLGGECAYWACVPTKSMLKAAKMYHLTKYATGRYGVQAAKVTYDFTAIMKRRDAVVKVLTGNGKRLAEYVRTLKVTVKTGPAHFIAHNILDVKGERVRGKAFVIATGSKDKFPVLDGLEGVPFWKSRDVVSMKSLPVSVAILGGGPVGTEFATLFGLLGVKTTLLEYGEHILPREDGEIAALAETHLREQGVQIYTKTKALGVKKTGHKMQLTFQVGKQPRKTISIEKLIVAVGRQPNIDTMSLDRAGVKLNEKGRLEVSARLETNQAHIFAAGDVTSALLFTHTASHEGYIAGWNAAKIKTEGKKYVREERVVPRITFVDPEIASVGITVAEAAKLKKKVKIYRSPFSVLGRAAIDGNRDGLLKVITDAKSGQVLGAHVIGERAGEIMHELALAMYAGIPFVTVQSMLHAYPGWSECIPAAKT